MLIRPLNGASLKRRAVSAGVWTMGGYGLAQVLRLGSNLIMTRLLLPDMFGVLAIGYIVITSLTLFAELGLRANVIQSDRGNDPVFLNTAWVIQIGRGVLLCCAGLCVSLFVLLADRAGLFPVNSVYVDPRLPSVVAILSTIAVINGFSSTKIYEAGRNLTLARVTIMNVMAQIAGLLCMLAWVLISRSVWVLVAGGVASALARALMSHLLLPGTKNRWQWDHSAFTAIFHFGKWMLLSSILSIFASNADRLLLGGMVDTATLGIYAIAGLLVGAIQQGLSKIIFSVAFPALSEVARRGSGIKHAYYRTHLLIALIAYFSAGFLMTSGQSLIHVLYDHRYTQAGWMLEILAASLLAVPASVGVQCYVALGMPSLTSIVSGFRLALLLVAIPLGFQFFGFVGALWGVVAGNLSSIVVVAFLNWRHNLLDVKLELLCAPIIIIGLGAGKLAAFALGAPLW